MIAIRMLFGLLLLVLGGTQSQEKSASSPPQPILTSVCAVVKEPAAFDNKLVKIRGYVTANFEYSVLADDSCSERGIWFVFADGSGPPSLSVWANGKAPKKTSTKIELVPLRLLRDSNYDALVKYWSLSEKGKACADAPPPADLLPDCRTYRVTATFVGRLDGVSSQTRMKHQKHPDSTNREGFGLMGMFDAQIVVQSVEHVVAIDESELRQSHPN